MTHDTSVERVLNAPMDEVFDAYSSVGARRIWIACGDNGQPLSMEVSGDPVPGGGWSTAWGSGEDDLSHEYRVYQVIDRPHRIVTPATFRAPDGRATRSELELTGIPTEQVRDFVTTVAWPGVLDKLEWYLGDR